MHRKETSGEMITLLSPLLTLLFIPVLFFLDITHSTPETPLQVGIEAEKTETLSIFFNSPAATNICLTHNLCRRSSSCCGANGEKHLSINFRLLNWVPAPAEKLRCNFLKPHHVCPPVGSKGFLRPDGICVVPSAVPGDIFHFRPSSVPFLSHLLAASLLYKIHMRN